MITEEQYRELREQVTEARQQAERARGALDQIIGQLKEEFGCSNLKEAEAHLEKLCKEQTKAQKDFDKAYHAYQRKWKEEEPV